MLTDENRHCIIRSKNAYTQRCHVKKFQLFSSELKGAIDLLLPRKTVNKVNSSDRPWITKRLKVAITKRQEALINYGKDSNSYKMWRNKVHKEIKAVKRLYYRNKVADLELVHTPSRNWWNHIKHLSGKEQDCPEVLSLSNNVNNFFISLADHFTPLEPPPVAPLEVFPEFLVSEWKAFRALSAVKIGKVIGPDCIPNRVLKEFAQELAPLV